MMIYKKISFCLLFLLLNIIPVKAEEVPVKISPIQVLSTHHDEIEVGDRIKFCTVKDVYVDDVLYIKKNTDITGVVDFIHSNGWGGDSADIVFKNFYTTDINNKKVTIEDTLDINGNNEMSNDIKNVSTERASSILSAIFSEFRYISYVGFIFRGSEINIEPDSKIYNIFLDTDNLKK